MKQPLTCSQQERQQVCDGCCAPAQQVRRDPDGVLWHLELKDFIHEGLYGVSKKYKIKSPRALR